MRYVYFTAVFFAALLLQFTFEGFLSVAGVPPPIAVAVLFAWFWRTDFFPRLWMALAAGVFLDSIMPFAFGVYGATLVAAALVMEGLKMFFSNVHSASSQALGIGSTLLFFSLAIPFTDSLLGYFQHGAPVFLGPTISYAAASLFWTLVLMLVFAGASIPYSNSNKSVSHL